MVRVHEDEVESTLNELLLKILDPERRAQLELRNNAEHIFFLLSAGGINGPSRGGTGGDHQERYKAYAYLMAAHLNHTEIIAYFSAVRLKRRLCGVSFCTADSR